MTTAISDLTVSFAPRASATRTSPFDRTSIHLGCSRLVAKALTWRPGAAIGVCPAAHPLAAGILSVIRLPCGFAAGITGVRPNAGSCEPSRLPRARAIAPPIMATPRANIPDTFMTPCLDCGARHSKLSYDVPIAVHREVRSKVSTQRRYAEGSLWGGGWRRRADWRDLMIRC